VNTLRRCFKTVLAVTADELDDPGVVVDNVSAEEADTGGCEFTHSKIACRFVRTYMFLHRTGPQHAVFSVLVHIQFIFVHHADTI
jgi:hypothetical protein